MAAAAAYQERGAQKEDAESDVEPVHMSDILYIYIIYIYVHIYIFYIYDYCLYYIIIRYHDTKLYPIYSPPESSQHEKAI
jgi:hypothetical protein